MGIEQPDDTTGPSQQWLLAFQQLFDPHLSHVALLHLDGTVLAVNAAWRRYAADNGVAAGYEFVGTNYLAVCEAGVAAGYPGAAEAYLGLLGVVRNGRAKFTMLYACQSPGRREWYRMWVEPQSPSVPAVIVAHQLVKSEPWVRGPGEPGDAHAGAWTVGAGRPALPQ